MNRLKELREQRRLNQQGLALVLNVSQSTISSYETGERIPDLDTLVTIAKYFGVSLDYLAELSDVKNPLTQGNLTPDEIELLHVYRQLDKTNKEKAFNVLQIFYDEGNTE